jgi:hypothetical protein
MAKDDWAIVVGIQSYPALESLSGPDNDARAFLEWLTDPAGGDVPEKHVQKSLTSLWKTPFRSVEVAKPTEEHIRKAGERLQNKGKSTPQRRIGRRLYLYMAGHGFAPRQDQTALLMANATKDRVGPPYHWLGPYTAEYFRRSGYFDEILLFMDCCREIYSPEGLNFAWGPVTATDFPERVKRFYAFATRWSRLSREEPMADGVVRGVFTAALLEGLRGAAYQPGSHGQITTASLQQYLQKKIPNLQPSDFVADDFVIATVQPVTYPVTIHLPAGSAGREVRIQDNSFKLVDQTIAAPPVWQRPLEKGLYQVLILSDGLQTANFEVTGTGGVDVNF